MDAVGLRIKRGTCLPKIRYAGALAKSIKWYSPNGESFMNFKPYPEPVQRTLTIAAALGISCEVIVHKQSGKTSEDAAKALDVDVAAVIKTLVLETDQGFAVAIITGDERLDLKAFSRRFRFCKVRLASPESVRQLTGYEIGGVPPIVFKQVCPVFVSKKLLANNFIIGSAGDRFHGLKIKPQQIPNTTSFFLNWTRTAISKCLSILQLLSAAHFATNFYGVLGVL